MKKLEKKIDFVEKEWLRLFEEASKTSDKKTKCNLISQLRDLVDEYMFLISIDAKLKSGLLN